VNSGSAAVSSGVSLSEIDSNSKWIDAAFSGTAAMKKAAQMNGAAAVPHTPPPGLGDIVTDILLAARSAVVARVRVAGVRELAQHDRLE
jgi:hypothetical protein